MLQRHLPAGGACDHSAPRPAMPAPVVWALAWVLPVALAAATLLVARPHVSGALALLLLTAVLLPAAALALVVRAGQHGGTALALVAALVVLLSDTTWRDEAESGLDLQSAAKLAVWLLPLLLLPWRWREVQAALARPASALVALLGLWCLAGAGYSVTPVYTAAAAVALLGIWVAGTLSGRLLPGDLGLVAVGAALAALMTASLALAWLAPERAYFAMDNGRHLRLAGVFGSANNLGRAAALLLLLAVLVAASARRRATQLACLFALPLAGLCLSMSGSRTSVLALGAALAVALLVRRRLLACGLALGLLCLVLTVAAMPAWQAGLVSLVSRSGDAAELASFTGRTDIWAAVGRLVDERPVLGHGFASSRVVIPAGFQAEFGWTTTSAHNLWLQAWLTTGAIGLALVVAAQLAWAAQAALRPHATRDALVVFVLVVGVFEASALGPSVNLMTFVWCWAAGMAPTPPGRLRDA